MLYFFCFFLLIFTKLNCWFLNFNKKRFYPWLREWESDGVSELQCEWVTHKFIKENFVQKEPNLKASPDRPWVTEWRSEWRADKFLEDLHSLKSELRNVLVQDEKSQIV